MDSGGDLPERIAIFPLSGALLLPGGKLPLNIFEPRYLEMVRDAMSAHRIIGMIQPVEHESRKWKPNVYDVGCAGRISSFSETDDGRFLIVLTGMSRFRVAKELDATTLYRQAQVDWSPYAVDRQKGLASAPYDRPRLLHALKQYLETHGIPAEWSQIERAPDEALINSLAMVCPFAPAEKQALLEAPTLLDRAEVIIALIEMALLQQGGPDTPPGGQRLN